MNKIALLISMIVLLPLVTNAQELLKNLEIEKQYVNKGHKTFFYQVSPQQKAADKWVLEISKIDKQRNSLEKIANQQFSDTTLSYTEYKAPGDSTFTPQSYIHLFSEVQEEGSENYTSYYNQYDWIADSSDWGPNSLQTRFTDSSYGDSSITYYYNYGEYEPYYGRRYKSPLEASEGADFESIWDNYNPTTGWEKSSRDLSYRNELDQDTLNISYQFNLDLDMYEISSKRRSQSQVDYYMYSNEYYNKGQIYNSRLEEQTLEYMLSENIYYALGTSGVEDGEITSGERSYVKLEEGNRYIYQISKEYDANLLKWIGVDSLNFNYLDNDAITEATGYEWNDSLWIFSQAYTSYQRTILEDQVVVDSIVVYSIEFNEETTVNEIAGVELKTEMDYDENGNQIEVRTYSIIGDSLMLTSRTVREFKAFKGYLDEIYYQQVNQKQYGRIFGVDGLYLTSEFGTIYDADGIYNGGKTFYFSATGDTTYGYITQRESLSDGSTIEVRFDWNISLQEMQLSTYRIFGRTTTGDSDQRFTQSLNSRISNGMETISRSLNARLSYPGIFNDGPILAEMGDTLVYYVSAINPDLSIPKVEVSNMPATATFDPETRRFFWIVDEANPIPMTYKAIRGDKSVITEVEFVTDQFTVSNEDESKPNAFTLSQNYPNPFNPTTNISFNLPSTNEVSLKVYNLLGQEVATLVDGRLNSGNHTIKFDASRLASGVYIYRIISGEFSQTKKMMLIK